MNNIIHVMNKRLNKFVLIFCVLMMIAPFFTFNVGATDYDIVLEDWDSYASGVDSGSNDYITWESSSGMTTSTTQSHSETMSLKIIPSPTVKHTTWLNLTDETNIFDFEFYFYYDEADPGSHTNIILYDDNDVAFIKFSLDAYTDYYAQCWDYDGWSNLWKMPEPAGWYGFGFSGNYTLGNPSNYVYYYMTDTDGVIIESVEKRWISLSTYGSYQTLSYITITETLDAVVTATMFLDDFSVNYNDYTDFAFDSNDNIGNIDTACIITLVSAKELEFNYRVPVTIDATGFDLLVDEDMHYYDDVLSNYDLYINGESMGKPTEWKQYGINYVLRWEFTIPKVIENSEILYEIWHDVGVPINYWKVGVGCNYRDMDNDGDAQIRYSNTYPNGVYDGTYLASDVAYKIYFDTFSFVEDVLDVTYDSITTTDGSYYVGSKPVPLTYMLQTSNMVYDNYVKIWNDDTGTEITINSMQGFPYLCTAQLETIGFVPFVSANYTAELYINGANVTNVSFRVYDNINSDMYVFTYPNPSKIGKEIRVEYNFDHPSDKDGAIFLCRLPNLNSYISVNHLSDGDSGILIESHDRVGTYYYILAVDIDGNGTYGIVDNGIHPHKVVSEQSNNFFTLGRDALRLNEQGTTTQTVAGQCNLLYGNCFIYDNNKLIKTITDSPFSYSYEIYTAGLHTVEMRLITNVTTVLFTLNYSVSTFTGEDEIGQIEDTSYLLHNWVYDMYGDMGVFLAGVSIVLGFMFIPFALVLYVNVNFNKNIALGDLHWSIYLIFAIVGVIVDVQLHLAELWIILLVCVVSIAIAVLSWNGNR